MGITQQSAAARLIQPGVCTSSTRPASPFEGQAIFETDTDRMLIWNGTAWVIPNAPAQNPTGLELIKTDTITSGSSKEITGAFSSLYDNYRIVVSNLRLSGIAGIFFRMGTVNTTVYYYGGTYVAYNSTTVAGEVGQGQTRWLVGMVGNSGKDSGGFVELQGPYIADTTSYQAMGSDPRFDGAGARQFTGWMDTTSQYTSFSLIADSSATFSSCDIYVYGYRK